MNQVLYCLKFSSFWVLHYSHFDLEHDILVIVLPVLNDLII
jgi:hypothetical protein